MGVIILSLRPQMHGMLGEVVDEIAIIPGHAKETLHGRPVKRPREVPDRLHLLGIGPTRLSVNNKPQEGFLRLANRALARLRAQPRRLQPFEDLLKVPQVFGKRPVVSQEVIDINAKP